MNPGQQVRHYSLVCRRMCLDGAGLAGRLSSAREKGVGTAALVCRRLPPCQWTPFQAFPLLRCLRSGPLQKLAAIARQSLVALDMFVDGLSIDECVQPAPSH